MILTVPNCSEFGIPSEVTNTLSIEPFTTLDFNFFLDLERKEKQ